MYVIMVTLFIWPLPNRLIFTETESMEVALGIALRYCRERLNAEILNVVYEGNNVFTVYKGKQQRGLFMIDTMDTNVISLN